MTFEFIRSLMCNFKEIESYIPKNGKILDVGCGHGIFSKLLIEGSITRKVLGIDPSETKIVKANEHNPDTKRLKFKKAYIEDVNGKFDVISAIDVLYLLPSKEKNSFVKNARKLLKHKGVLILVINGNKPYWIHNVLRFEEYLMTRVFKLTYTDYKGVYIESEEYYEKLLDDNGFNIEKKVNIKSTLPYPHVLFKASI